MPDISVFPEIIPSARESVVSIINLLIKEGYRRRASDIHIDPTDAHVRVRLRIDGILEDMPAMPMSVHAEIISRIKVLARLRTDEHYAPQDGRFHHVIDNQSLDIRVSVAPTYYGENVVMRLLADSADTQTLETLGFSIADRERIGRAIARPHGMILATGPTGAGKTTTLYTLIKMLNQPGSALVTIEDPIEYAINGIEQIQVNPRVGLTFATGLKSIVRQDPDIIMVGEIRDTETAGLAINTALTGHLVFSTLHTTDAATTLPRFLDMGVEPYLVASTVTLIIGQRLVRKICDHCKREIPTTALQRESLSSLVGELPDTLFIGTGCACCNQTGFCGRIGIYEVMPVDEAVRAAFLRRAAVSEIKHIAITGGMITMAEDGFAKVARGLTTVEEILRVIYE